MDDAQVLVLLAGGVHELREMFEYYEQYTYFGPEAGKRIAAANALVSDGFTSFADWAKIDMKAGDAPGRWLAGTKSEYLLHAFFRD